MGRPVLDLADSPARCLPRAALLLGLLGCGVQRGDHSTDTAESECSGHFDTFHAGVSKLAQPGDVTVELARSDPDPPAVRRANTWWLHLSDAEGAPLPGARLSVTPHMPEHQHGSAQVVVTELEAGEYKLSPIELVMPGVWEIPVSVTPPEGQTGEASFRLCIAEQ